MCGRLHELQKRIKAKWDKQPDIYVFQPIRIKENPKPVPFQVEIENKKLKGFILRQDEKPMTISQRGSSKGLVIPSKWVNPLNPKLKPYLIQVQNQIGIVFFPEDFDGGDLNE